MIIIWQICFYRGARVWWSSGLHPGSIWSQEQIDDQRDILSHDMRHWHHQHPIRLRRCYWRYHRQQPSRMRSLLKWTQIPFSHKSNKNTQAKKKWRLSPISISIWVISFFSPPPNLPCRSQHAIVAHTNTHTQGVFCWIDSLLLPQSCQLLLFVYDRKKGAHTVFSSLGFLISISFSCAHKNNPSPPYEH